MLDLTGLQLQPEERDRLRHPLVGGVILFSRNYLDPQQLAALVHDIHILRTPPLLVSVDHEGGAVQRFRQGFVALPPCAALGRLYDGDRRRGLQAAADLGWLMAAELRAVGVDFSFAPVLDLGRGLSRVINDRAFHADPEGVTALAHAYIRGMHRAGMAAVGKHFPGHGSVEADSHHEVPVDPRPYDAIEALDLVPFARLAGSGLAALMPAHVIYDAVDPRPAAFSRVWLQEVLRRRLGFQGCLFSDDLSMAGAAVAGDLTARARAALSAGCDMVLVCNDPRGAAELLDRLADSHEPLSQVRLMRMHGRRAPDWAALHRDPDWVRAAALAESLGPERELALGDDERV